MIENLFLAAEKSSENGDISSYFIDDSEHHIETVYRNPEDIFNAIGTLEKLRLVYMNRLNNSLC